MGGVWGSAWACAPSGSRGSCVTYNAAPVTVYLFLAIAWAELLLFQWGG